MSVAGLSFDTATRRTGVVRELEREEIRARTEVRFWESSEARAGSTLMLAGSEGVCVEICTVDVMASEIGGRL